MNVIIAECLQVTADMLSPTQLSMLSELERAALVRNGRDFVGPIKPKGSGETETKFDEQNSIRSPLPNL